MEGFRYELTAYFYGDGENLEYFRLGVKFPDQSEVMPISKEFLWRSLGKPSVLPTLEKTFIAVFAARRRCKTCSKLLLMCLMTFQACLFN